jgi:hypothetical protein
VAAPIEHGRHGQHRREVAARGPGDHEHAHTRSESDAGAGPESGRAAGSRARCP